LILIIRRAEQQIIDFLTLVMCILIVVGTKTSVVLSW